MTSKSGLCQSKISSVHRRTITSWKRTFPEIRAGLESRGRARTSGGGGGAEELRWAWKARAPCVTHVKSKPASPTPGSAHCRAAAYDRPPGSPQDVSRLCGFSGTHRPSGKCRARPSSPWVCALSYPEVTQSNSPRIIPPTTVTDLELLTLTVLWHAEKIQLTRHWAILRLKHLSLLWLFLRGN